MNPLEFDVVGFPQFFNTPGTEITPRSNVVCEDFEFDGFFHRFASRRQDW